LYVALRGIVGVVGRGVTVVPRKVPRSIPIRGTEGGGGYIPGGGKLPRM